MKKNKQFAFRLALAASIVTLVSASAFAESRHSNGTQTGRESGRISRGTSTGRAEVREQGQNERPVIEQRTPRFETRVEQRTTPRIEPRVQVQQAAPRVESRDRFEQRGVRNRDDGNRGDWRDNRDGRDEVRVDRNRNDDESRGRSDSYRDPARNRGGYDSRHYNNHGNRTPYYANGRVSRIHRYGSGYRIWISGAPYPFFIPEAFYHRNHIRLGLILSLGGFYNPLGYYDYYDPYGSYYGGGYYGGYGSGYSAGRLRGVVESVDYRRDTFVLRNDATGNFVTILLRGREDVRPGDYIEVSGDWTRSGIFEAYDVNRLDDDYYRR